MDDVLVLVGVWGAGLGLGALFFGGLWWTVRKGVSAKNPALWFVGGLVLRTSIALTGFYHIGHGHWERLLLCLLGFIMARFIVIRRTQASRTPPYQV